MELRIWTQSLSLLVGMAPNVTMASMTWMQAFRSSSTLVFMQISSKVSIKPAISTSVANLKLNLMTSLSKANNRDRFLSSPEDDATPLAPLLAPRAACLRAVLAARYALESHEVRSRNMS
jgi:hypothetical protein